MDIHEYQAKEILAGFGVPIPRGGLAYSPEQAAYRAREVGGDKWVVKAQVHTGGRGQAGGVKLCGDEHEVLDAANDLFGKRSGHPSDRRSWQGGVPGLCGRCGVHPEGDLSGVRAGPENRAYHGGRVC